MPAQKRSPLLPRACGTKKEARMMWFCVKHIALQQTYIISFARRSDMVLRGACFYRRTPMSLPFPETLNRIFQTGCMVRPDEPALKRPDRLYTFRDLMRRSDALAAMMQARFGLAKGDRVVVIAEKAPEIIIAAAAAWKAGAIYVPIDAKNPAKRTEYILGSIEPKIVVSTQAKLDEVAESLGSAIGISYEQIIALDPAGGTPTSVNLRPEDDAIIIHTSGSTGFPKGAVLSHGSVTTYLRNHNELIRFTPQSVGMNNGPFHFDVSIQDTFLPLYFGATVIMHDDLFVSRLMLPYMAREKVSHLIAVSSVLDLISQDDKLLASLGDAAPKTVITGGEICDVRLINRWLTHYPSLRLFYGYGPTECNSLCMAYQVEKAEPDRVAPFPIGMVFPGHKAVLLAEDGSVITKPDTVGVLAVSGPQLMSGYWRNQEQTALVTRIIDGERYYVTGDRCLRDKDGLYLFAGRNDTEVKIRGRRINLNEIRNALLAHPAAKYAVVGTIKVQDEVRIFGFVQIVDKGQSISHDEIEAVVAKHVPDYMRPWYLCMSGEIPKTSTGKVSERLVSEGVSAEILSDPQRAHLTWPSAQNMQAA
jgi:D-alanine--poly(phosphoribitol) ligase subunit 1